MARYSVADLQLYRPPLGAECEISRNGQRITVFVVAAWDRYDDGWDIDSHGYDHHGRPVELTEDDLDDVVQQLNRQAEPSGDFDL